MAAQNPLPPTQLQQQADIFTKITKTVVCKVKLTETVKKFKESLREKGAVLDHIHGLSYGDTLLEDDKTLDSYGIHSNSTLCLIEGMKLFVEIPSRGRTVVVEAGVDDTVGSIKSMIQASEGIYSDEFILLYDGILLEDDRTMYSLNICNECTLHLVFCQKDVLTVFVKACNSIVKLQVKATSVIGDIKAIAAKMLRVSADFLRYEGKKLNDFRNLSCYNIKNESVIELICLNFQIFVKAWNGNTVVLNVRGSSTISDIKQMIFQKLNIPIYRQRIYYAGKMLANNNILQSYGICNQCTLNMVILFSSNVSESRN